MARVIGVMGESGSGKTTAMRKLDPKTTFYFDCDKKGLNWKGWRKQYSTENKNYVCSDFFSTILTMLDRVNTEKEFAHIKTVVVDTLNGMMVAEEMKILAMPAKGNNKRDAWLDLAQNGWELVNKCLALRDTLTVVILCHSETVSDDNGIVRTRIKTNGRKLEKLVLESKMTTVVWAVRQNGEYKFILSADNSTCKIPMGAIDGQEIENDITIVINALDEF